MSRDLDVVFVCWGNICRSPMAERVARKRLADAGVEGVRVWSAGVSSEELGNPIDRRAQRTLAAHGYDHGGHRAHRITRQEIADADLIIAAEPVHVDMMRRLVPDAEVALLTDFDPDAVPGSGVPDPWYGAEEGFEDTLAAVESAMPGVVNRILQLQGK